MLGIIKSACYAICSINTVSWRQFKIFLVHWHHLELETFFSSLEDSMYPKSEVEVPSLAANKPVPETSAVIKLS